MSSYLSGLRVYASIGAWLAVGVSLVAWLATGRAEISAVIGFVIGLGVALIAGATAVRATAKTANPGRYQTLKDWIQELKRTAVRQGTTDPRLDEQENLLDTSTGPLWITGEGYINVSRSLADVEADLMERSTKAAEMLDQAQFDKLRLTGSSVDDRDSLLALLNTSIGELKTAVSPAGPAAGAVAAGPAAGAVAAGAVAAGPAAGAVAAGPAAGAVAAGPAAGAVAATPSPVAANPVKQVRKALNDQRDSSRAGLARLRMHTLDVLALAGTLVYLLVIVATTYGSRRPELASATAFFLVAALVGLIAALNSMSTLSTADDDFGLASARLTANAVLSGLSGVGGVVLIYFSGAAGALLGSASSPRAAGTTAAGLSLSDIFDVVNHPVTLVVAAVFGATPALLITGLTKLGDRYATNLTSTHPGSTEKTGS